MSIDLNQALNSGSLAKEVGKIQLSYFGKCLVYKPNRMCTMW